MKAWKSPCFRKITFRCDPVTLSSRYTARLQSLSRSVNQQPVSRCCLNFIDKPREVSYFLHAFIVYNMIQITD